MPTPKAPMVEKTYSAIAGHGIGTVLHQLDGFAGADIRASPKKPAR